jgi:DNA helicase-2/ATP-dependent DNA helicase PcrA
MEESSNSTGTDEEEERRLCFVGMTRAKTCLTLSRARYRMLRGVTQRTTRSRFLDELPPEGVEWPESENVVTRRSIAVPAANGHPPADIAEWTVGTLVRHPQHGLGQILSIHRGTRRTHVDVQFENGSRKSWVVEFADLQRVDFDEVE